MRHPSEYIDVLNQFNELNVKGVQLEDELTRDDWICLKMAAYCLELPIEVRYKASVKTIYLIRKALV